MSEPIQFTPTQDFADEDLRSVYCKGLNYTVKAGNDRLAAKVREWLAQENVVLGTAADSEKALAKLAGAGTVE